jgi:predicted flap endonuclease-1-like 5' DNA nuclease
MKTDTTKPSHYELLLKAYDKALSTYERTITDEKTAKHFYKNAPKETSKADKKILKLEYKRVKYRRKSRKMSLQIADIHLKIWAKAHDEEVKIYQLSDTAMVEEAITTVEKSSEKSEKTSKKEDKKAKKELKKEDKKEAKKEVSKPKASKIKLERVEETPEVKKTTDIKSSKEIVQAKPVVTTTTTTTIKATDAQASKPNPQIINQIKEERSIVLKPAEQKSETVKTTTYVSTGKPVIKETVAEKVKTPQATVTPVSTTKPTVKETPVETLKAPQVNKTVSTAKPAVKAPQAKDNLSLVEGIGAKVTQTLHDAGIHTFAQLAKTNVDTLKSILKAAKNYLANPTTWAEQAQLIVDNKIDELKTLQETLKGGRKV